MATKLIEKFDRLTLRYIRTEDVYERYRNDFSKGISSIYHITLADGTIYNIGGVYNYETGKELETFVFKPDEEFGKSGLYAKVPTGYSKYAFISISGIASGIEADTLCNLFLNFRVGTVNLEINKFGMELDVESGTLSRHNFDELIHSLESIGYRVDYEIVPNETTFRIRIEMERVDAA